MFSNSARGGACWRTRGGRAPRDQGAAAPFFAAQPPRSCSGTRNEFRRRLARSRRQQSKFQMPHFPCWSRGARPPSGAVGCASRPTCRKFHRPEAAFFSIQPAGARAGAPEAGALPETRALPRHFLRRSRLDPVAELGTSFDGGWRDLAGSSRNFKCRTFRAGLGERARPRVPSGAPRARLVENSTGLRPHVFQFSPRGRVLAHPRRARSPGPGRCRAIFCGAAASIL
jgi:hypothetical protein